MVTTNPPSSGAGIPRMHNLEESFESVMCEHFNVVTAYFEPTQIDDVILPPIGT